MDPLNQAMREGAMRTKAHVTNERQRNSNSTTACGQTKQFCSSCANASAGNDGRIRRKGIFARHDNPYAEGASTRSRARRGRALRAPTRRNSETGDRRRQRDVQVLRTTSPWPYRSHIKLFVLGECYTFCSVAMLQAQSSEAVQT